MEYLGAGRVQLRIHLNRIEESEKNSYRKNPKYNEGLGFIKVRCLFIRRDGRNHNNESSKNSGHEWASFIFKTRRRATSLYIEEAPLNQNNYVLG